MINTAEVKWIKLTTDMFDNRKIKQIRRLPEGNNIVLIWVMLLTIAGRCNASGMIFLTENIPYTLESLAVELDFDQTVVRLALDILQKFGMIVCDEKDFYITNWEEYQNIEGMELIREQNRLRQQKFRDNKKKLMESSVCQYCGGTATGYDHILAVSRGGNSTDSNMIPCCKECNQIKNDKPVVDFLNNYRYRINDEIVTANPKLKQFVTLDNVTNRYIVTPCNATDKDIDKDIRNKSKNIYEEFAKGNSDLLDALKEYDAYRKLKKKPLTPSAKERLLKRLTTLTGDQKEWVKILYQSIDQGWTDIYELKTDYKFHKKVTPGMGTVEERQAKHEFTPTEF